MKAAIALLLLFALPAAAQGPGRPSQFLPAVPPPSAQTAPLPGYPGIMPSYPGLAIMPLAPVTPAWLPQSAADLRALDKVTARTAAVTGRLGDTIRFGSLSVIVRQCIVRPPDRAQDAAAWVEITDANGGPGFRGWMLASAPSLSMLEHPVYDIRVSGCRP